MEYNPKISIIVPMYNSESTIGKCIESILQQTLSELEVILVNDGSTDNTLDICCRITRKQRINFCKKERCRNI